MARILQFMAFDPTEVGIYNCIKRNRAVNTILHSGSARYDFPEHGSTDFRRANYGALGATRSGQGTVLAASDHGSLPGPAPLMGLRIHPQRCLGAWQ